MKKIFILLFLSFFTNWGSAQNFAPTGAKWHYTKQNYYNPFENILFSTIESTGDTTLLGKACKVLKVGPEDNYPSCSDIAEKYYVYSDSCKVYWFKSQTNEFTVLYNFCADVGDSWQTKGEVSPDITISVDSTSSFIFNNDTLKQLFVTITDSFQSYPGYDIIENIGYSNYMFPDPLFNVIGDCPSYHTGPIRCYEDSFLGFHNWSDSILCDTIYIKTSVEEFNNISPITLYPNPAQDYIYVKNYKNSDILLEVFNTNGAKVLITKVSDQLINIANLANGFYIYKFSENQKSPVYGKLIKQ